MYLTQALRRAAQTDRHGLATIHAARRQTWSSLLDRVARLASALQRLGLAPGDRVAILAQNSDRYLEYYFAVPWAGGIIVPINNRWSLAEMQYAMGDAEPVILFTDDEYLPQASRLAQAVTAPLRLIHAGDGPAPAGWLAYEALIAGAPVAADTERDPDAPLAIFYTGGTTGFPKGVMLSSRNLFASSMVALHEFGLQPGDSFLHSAPMFHLADGVFVFCATLAGASHCIVPAFEPAKVLRAIEEQRITTVTLIPTMFKMLLDHPDYGRTDLSSLRYIVYGAAPMPDAVLQTAMRTLPRARFVQAYGQTELSPIATILRPQYHVLEGPAAAKRTSCGQAALGVEVMIADPEGRELPRNVVGEIRVRGPNAMLGYWRKPEETAKALVAGWVCTGDGGYMDDDGFVYVVDRIKDMVISGGENIYSVEVEAAIMSHAGVSACAVIGIPDERWGEVVHAIVVPKAGVDLATEEVIAHCRERIAGYKCPKSVEIRATPLPLSGAGKILKRELREPFWKGHSRRVI